MKPDDGNGVANESSAAVPEDYVLLGRLGRVFGLAGAVRFRQAGSAEAAAVLELEQVLVEGHGPAAIREAKVHGDAILLRLGGIRSREAAQRLVNANVYARAEDLPTPDEGLHYHDELVGAQVTLEGVPFGTVRELRGVEGAEFLAVAREDGREVLIPLRAPYVQSTGQGIVITDPPPGLIEEDG